MDWRFLRGADPDRGPDFYLRCLQYGHHLWQRGHAARAILCLDRALFADVPAGEPLLDGHPLPYAALAWVLRTTPPGAFIGNPRVHYQHLADRVRGLRRDRKRWRAWACWQVVRAVRPEFPSDPRHCVSEPDRAEIGGNLDRLGLPGERALWNSACAGDRA
jgi:hypothetical protein